MEEKFVSICIPSYNRPETLLRLLNSIDCDEKWNVEIVICEDKSPKRELIAKCVEEYKRNCKYTINYYENEDNLGYDGNIRNLVKKATGEYVIFMGDDDVFIPSQLDNFLKFLNDNRSVGYVLRSYKNKYANGVEENYIYYDSNKFFEPGVESYIELFRKSVFISGFTFKRALALDTLTDKLDGTLLYQLYIEAEICINHRSCYYSTPFTMAYEEDNGFFFGNSKAEKGLYKPNEHTVSGELNFISSWFKVTEYIDKKYNINSTEAVKRDMSKYSFPMLALVMENPNGRRDIKEYYKELKKMGFDCTKYFTFYYYALLLFGVKNCKAVIILIKKICGRTPRL